MTDYLFDTDTRQALTPVGDGEWTAQVSPLWNIDGIPNGGYLMALCLVAGGQGVAHPDPLSMNSHFVGPTMPGGATVANRVIKRGRSVSVTAVDLVQNGRVTVTSLITWGDLSTFTGPSGPLRPPPSPARGLGDAQWPSDGRGLHLHPPVRLPDAPRDGHGGGRSPHRDGRGPGADAVH